MELTFAERWILSNQYRILEELLPDQASDFARAREVVERGYEYWYSEVSSNISEETMSEEEGQEVNNILFMFRVLNGSYTQLLDKEGIDAAYTTFRGFDGNDETRQFAFAQFRCEEPGIYDEFKGSKFNSHWEMLPKYRRMLAKYDELFAEMHKAGRDLFNKAEIIEITSA